MFVKRRPHAAPGTIPYALDMFRSEVRFYREIAPEVGVRVPVCHEAHEDEQGFRLVLEDLSDWSPGGDPVAVAGVLAELHRRWEGRAEERWPWLRRVGAGAELVRQLFDRTWPAARDRGDITPVVRAVGDGLVGRLAELEWREGEAGPPTLVHGDASLRNVRTSADSEVALLNWEDVRLAPGATDLAWLLVSSVEPDRWDDVLGDRSEGLRAAMPAALGQALFGLCDAHEGSAAALSWVARIEAAHVWAR